MPIAASTYGRDATTVPSVRKTGVSRQWLLVFLTLFVALAGLSWAVASPLGASPDEDFHLTSMWCPPPIEDSGCARTLMGDEVAVVVPQSLAKENVTCYAFDHDNSAQCTLKYSDSLTAPSRRWDDGNYPWGYYQFAHLFVGDSVKGSALALRFFNTLLAVGLLGSICALADRALRVRLGLVFAVAWLPMGFYFIASLNPSSWAMTGVAAFAAGLFASSRSTGPRRWGLLVCAALGAVLACTSRGDSAFFLFVCTVAFVFALPLSRRLLPEGALACAASIAGIWVMSRTNVARNTLTPDSPDAPLSFLRALWVNVKALPSYVAGFAGHGTGPGWNDVSYRGTVSYMAAFIMCAVIVWGLCHVSWRRFLSAGVVLGALTGVPVLIGVVGRFSNVEHYQPRYMLPLFAVFLLMLVAPSPISSSLGAAPRVTRPGLGPWMRAGVWALWGLWSLAYAYALYLVLLRYTMGRTPRAWPFDFSLRNLNAIYEWWWPGAPIGPMTLWAAGVVAVVVASGCALVLAGRGREVESAG